MMALKQKSKSMIQGKEILISGGKMTIVEGNYHEHNTAYVVEASSLKLRLNFELEGQDPTNFMCT
jgi:hypothetical protein